MPYSGWNRVATGFQMVARAAVARAADQSTHVASRALIHGADIVTRATVAPSQELIQKMTQRINEMHSFKSDDTMPLLTSEICSSQVSNRSDEAERIAESRKVDHFDERSSIDASQNTTPIDPYCGQKDDPVGSAPPTLPRPHHTPEPSQEVVKTSEFSVIDPFAASNVKLLQEESPMQSYVRLEESSIVSPPETTKSDPFSSTTAINTVETIKHIKSYDRLREGRPVPSTRLERAVGFAQLGFGLAFGMVGEISSRVMGGGGNSTSIVVTDANADRLSSTLCRMRGAALKMGQMLSIQDETLLPSALTRALNQVRQGADAMPRRQLIQQLEVQLGANWQKKFVEFDELPFAAASIGQVHRAKVTVGSSVKDVVVKVQYPGVANSIESDLKNLTMLVKMTGLAPKGLFIDNVIRVGRDELKVECDYLREKDQQRRFKHLVESDPVLRQARFAVPEVIDELTTAEIITSEFCPGGTIDKVVQLSQEERNRIGTHILYLTVQELFVWRFMQTDPNWGNFLYDIGSQTTFLIDFGATREYSKCFVDGYLRIVCANANRDETTLMDMSHKMKFLTGDENEVMLEAHKMSGFTVGEPFASDEPFNFRDSNISSRLGEHSSAFMQHRLTPPPEEVYTLHRKLAGAYMLCIKLGASVDCRRLLRNVVDNHTFDDGMEPPKM